MDDINLGRGPEVTIYHVHISEGHLLSLRRLDLKYLIRMILVILIKCFTLRTIHSEIAGVDKIISK